MSWTRFHPATRIAIAVGAILSIASFTGWERVGEALAHFTPGGGFESRCEDLPPSAVSISMKAQPASENRAVPSDVLTGMTEAPSQAQRTIGLTQAKFGHRSTLELTGVEDRMGARACVRPSVSVELFLAPMTVYIAREYSGDPCRARVIREHEQRHVETYLAFARESVPRLRAELERTVGTTPHYGFTIAEAQRTLDRRLGHTLGSFMRDAEQTLAARQAAIDTREEYERIRLACASSTG
jgi:hypothetical protein